MCALSDVYRVVDRLAFRAIEGQVVIVDPHESRLITLNESASMLWCAVDGATPLAALVELLEAQFDASRERLEGDVVAFVEQMCSRGLLERAP